MKKFSKEKHDDLFTIIDDIPETSSHITAPHTLTPEEVLGTEDSSNGLYNSHNALEALKKRMSTSSAFIKSETVIPNKTTVETEKSQEPAKKSLLDKCQPYLIEDDGTKASPDSQPLYKLQSVAEILKSDSEKVLQSLSEKYDISFDDLGYTTEKTVEKQEMAAPEIKEPAPPPKTESPKKEPVTSFEDKLVISDIDTPLSHVEKPKNDRIFNTATITFTPISDSGADKKISISTSTRPLDLTGELANIPDSTDEDIGDEVILQKNDFEEYVPEDELNDEKDAGRLTRKFSVKKRNFFISSVVSVFITLLLCVNLLPFMQSVILAHTEVSMIVCTCLTAITVLFNIDCFKALGKIFSQDSSPDISAAFSVLTVLLYGIFGILNNENTVYMLLTLSGILAFRSVSNFFKASYMLTNLKIAASPAPKNTLKLINDSAITYTMAENSVEGDALVADTQSAGGISDFMKYSTHGAFIDGKLPFITAASLILSVVTGIACAVYFDGISYGFYAAAVIQCLTALPTAFLIDVLPLYRASKRLSSSGAMILGKTGAERAEMANAAVISADKLFPAGSVTLHQMQALSANNLEDTIVRAASLTECLGSTLAPIFKTIAGTGNITALPDSDTVKYEDRMGISGWVDNRLLFIGNRTLLETHGIPVPSLELDRKILRQGFFPVYVATQNRACALIVIQYNVKPEIAKELRKLTDSGVNLLISSCDPNLTEEMICDYFGLYNDSVKVMSAAGRHLHRNMTAASKTVSAPAVCGKGSVGIASVLNCASRIKQSNLLLTVAYIIAAILGTVIFAYSSFGGSGTLLGGGTVLLYALITTVISFLLYLIKRP